MQPQPFISDEKAAVSAEFALVVVPFLSIFFAVLGFGVMLWTSAALRYAAEDGARCAAIKSYVCGDGSGVPGRADAAKTINYALSRYEGPNLSPTFSYSPASCTGSHDGHTVIGEVIFPLNTGLINFSLPLTATACFP